MQNSSTQENRSKTHEEIVQLTADLKKNRGDTKIHYRHADNLSCITSANCNILKAMTARKPSESQPLVSRGRSKGTPNVSAASSTSKPSNSTGKRTRKTPT